MEVRYEVCFERLVPIERSRNIGNVRERVSRDQISKVIYFSVLQLYSILIRLYRQSHIGK